MYPYPDTNYTVRTGLVQITKRYNAVQRLVRTQSKSDPHHLRLYTRPRPICIRIIATLYLERSMPRVLTIAPDNHESFVQIPWLI